MKNKRENKRFVSLIVFFLWSLDAYKIVYPPRGLEVKNKFIKITSYNGYTILQTGRLILQSTVALSEILK